MHAPHPTPLYLVTNLSFKQTANTRKRYERVTPTAPITHINFFYIINLLLKILKLFHQLVLDTLLAVGQQISM